MEAPYLKTEQVPVSLISPNYFKDENLLSG